MGNKREPFEPGCFFHVYNHGNGDDNIFRQDKNYAYFLKKYGEYIEPVAETYAWCLMPNHFHFAIRIKDEKELAQTRKVFGNLAGLDGPSGLDKLISRKFGNFLNAYVKAFNKMYNRRGSLFLDNLKRKKVENKDYMIKLIHYIHYNPVHHGFVKNITDWEYSSYHAFQTPVKETHLKRETVLEWFGEVRTFEKIHRLKPKL